MKATKIISVMKRYELKFYLNEEQVSYFMNKILEYMAPDEHGLTTVASLYFDTPDYRLINKSVEKPKFKEKLRLRSYGLATEESLTFLEIKRKYNGVVYKRRIPLLEKDAINLIAHKGKHSDDQIGRELEFFIEKYPNLEPKYLIISDRIAYRQEESDLRVTIDLNPRYRVNDLNLHTSLEGTPLLEKGGAILEIKVQFAIPMWLTELLSKGKIYQTSFSKVGTAHKKEYKNNESISDAIKNRIKGEEYGFTI